jgi:hypothetical protein
MGRKATQVQQGELEGNIWLPERAELMGKLAAPWMGVLGARTPAP